MHLRNLVVLAALGLAACAPRVERHSCLHEGAVYADRSITCQQGAQYRCYDGEWLALGSACPGQPLALAQPCAYGGISYSSGAASCQGGKQFRCQDGAWRALGVACPVGDAPLRVLPAGRSCRLNDATIGHNSTVCRGGVTYLCSNGDWVDLGTMCR